MIHQTQRVRSLVGSLADVVAHDDVMPDASPSCELFDMSRLIIHPDRVARPTRRPRRTTSRYPRGKRCTHNRLQHEALPRPPRRGPIEAFRASFAQSRRMTLPRPPRRGPIEARGWRHGFGSFNLLPRPPRRGPIEASRDSWSRSTRQTSFRAPQGAAPLKPDDPPVMDFAWYPSAPPKARPH